MSSIKEKSDIVVMMMLYDSADTLRQSLEALATQTYQNFHLFVVDDSSTDGSFEIAQEYQNKFSQMTLMKNHKNKGAISNLHYTLQIIEKEMLEADYFLWACPDDWWSPEYLEVTRQALIDDPNSSVCQTGYDYQNIKTGYKKNYQLPSITGRKYHDIKRIFLPCEDGYYNQSIHGLIRMNILRDAYPDSEKLIAYISSTELSVIVFFFLKGSILYLDDVLYHKHVGEPFEFKYPDDPLTKLCGNPLRRMWAACIHLPRFIKIRQNDTSLCTVFLIWVHIFYFYGILSPIYDLKVRLSQRT